MVAASLMLAGGAPAAAQSSEARLLVPQPIRTRMGLVRLDGRRAPGFRLVDQHGDPFSLAQSHGHPIVLEFMDARCTDICPIVSHEFMQAARLLGRAETRIEFVAINVNQFHERVADVARFSREHGLDSIPTWHFLTGTTPELEATWKAYDVTVLPNRRGDVIHSSLLYFIDARGRERWLALPDRTKSAEPVWARGIALVARSLL
jgi:protein SCO1/2